MRRAHEAVLPGPAILTGLVIPRPKAEDLFLEKGRDPSPPSAAQDDKEMGRLRERSFAAFGGSG
jgi:hypothetical protein